MKKIVLIAILVTFIEALETSDRLFECTEIFKQRKGELLVELERIDEQKQALSALKIATEDLLKKREVAVSQKEEAVDTKLQIVEQKEKNIKETFAKNEKILQELKSLKMSKVAQTFAKMKAGAAANILSDMEAAKAVEILKTLKPKSVGQILTKMDAKKASEITLLLAQ